MEMPTIWEYWVDDAIAKLQSLNRLRSLQPIILLDEEQRAAAENDSPYVPTPENGGEQEDVIQVFEEMQPWDRTFVEILFEESSFQKWLHEARNTAEGTAYNPVAGKEPEVPHGQLRKMLSFSSNDYLGLSSHPSVRKAAAKAALEHGMGPRGGPLIYGYTNYHKQLESILATSKKKEDCLLCTTGYAANVAFMTGIAGTATLLMGNRKAAEEEKIAIFSDNLNHASIIDGARLADRQQNVELLIYRHNNMSHLHKLLSECKMRKKIVVSDSLFSMDGDYAPMIELANLRKKHGFLLVIDDAHGSFICGKTGGGVAEQFNCEEDVDICIGTLSKATGCLGGFIACSTKWKQVIISAGRSFLFSTAMPIPVAAAAHAAVKVAKLETWRRRALWDRIEDFRALTGIPVTSPIIPLVVGNEQKLGEARRNLWEAGFYICPVNPPFVHPNSCRIRITLCSVHTREDVEKLVAALSRFVNFKELARNYGSNIRFARL